MHSVERRVIDLLNLNAGAVSMTVQDRMLDTNRQELAGWQAAYVLQRFDGAWRAVAAVADGEVDAWAARGTPLGG